MNVLTKCVAGLFFSGALLLPSGVALTQQSAFMAPAPPQMVDSVLTPKIFKYSDVSDYISSDTQNFTDLQNDWGSRALDTDELKQLANGWLSSNEVSSPKAATGIEILKSLAENRDPEALTSLGVWANYPAFRSQLDNPAYYFSTAADLGDPTAMQLYGRVLQSGAGSPENYREAYQLFEKALTNGNKKAALDVAIARSLGWERSRRLRTSQTTTSWP